MTAAVKNFFFGPATTDLIAFPLVSVPNIAVKDFDSNRSRRLQTNPLLHQEISAVNDQNPGAVERIWVRVLVNETTRGRIMARRQDLWDNIGTTKRTLWLIDDTAVDVVTTSAGESSGAQVVVYGGSQVSWLAVNDYLFFPNNGGASPGDEVVVVSAVAATPSFSATLTYDHAISAVCYRVAMAFEEAVLQDIRLVSGGARGLGELMLRFVGVKLPRFGTTLPAT